jgi:hypothetical protein
MLKTIKLCCKLSFSFYYKLPESINKILYILGYISLMGPSHSLAIKQKADKHSDELSNLPIHLILIFETSMRTGCFLLISAAIESFLGEALFENYRIDDALALILLAGIIHLTVYYIAFILIDKKLVTHKLSNIKLIIYRLGRNTSYAILLALIVALVALINQSYNQVALFSGNDIQTSFMFGLKFFVLLGLFESFLMQGTPLSVTHISSVNTNTTNTRTTVIN